MLPTSPRWQWCEELRDVVRLLSWNVADLAAGRSGVAAVIRAARPDVAVLQEVPRRRWQRGAVEALATAAGLKLVVGGHHAAGGAVMVGPGVDATAAGSMALPVPRPFSPAALSRRPVRPFVRPRGVVWATVDVDGLTTTVWSVHLGLDPAERADHAQRLSRMMARAGGATIVAGDLNEHPYGPSWRTLMAGAGLRDLADPMTPTYPARRPRRRIDALLVDAVTAARISVPARVLTGEDGPDPAGASDHLPLLVTIDSRPIDS